MTGRKNVLTRSTNGVICGALTGLAEYYGLNRGRLQLLFLILGFVGIGFFLYAILWLCIPHPRQKAALLARRSD